MASIDWSPVEHALQEGTRSGYKIAVIETEKIFQHLLEAKIGGDTVSRVAIALPHLTAPQEMERARMMYTKIFEEPGFELSREDTKEILAGYWRAITDIEHIDPETITPSGFSLAHIASRRTLLIAGAGSLGFLIAVLLLAETEQGRSVATGIVTFAHFSIYTALPVLAGAGILILGLRAYVRFRRSPYQRIHSSSSPSPVQNGSPRTPPQ